MTQSPREHASSDVDFSRTDAVGRAVAPSHPGAAAARSAPRALKAVLTAAAGGLGVGLALGAALHLLGATTPAVLLAGAVTAALVALHLFMLRQVRRRRSDLREHDAQLRQLLGSASGMCLWTWRQPEAGRPVSGEAWFSEAWTETFGLPAGTFEGPDGWFERIHPEDLGGLVNALERVRVGDQPNLRRHYRLRHVGEWRWIEVHARAVDLADGRVLAGAVQDVTVHHSMQERLAHTAFHDALTGLPNRALFLDRLAHCTARARRNPRYRFAVVYLDIDDFKLINDSLGHHAGDALLAVVARRLLASARPGDTVARIGGDEFTILLEPVESSEDAERVAMRLRSVVHGNVEVAGHHAQISTSVGIAFSSSDYLDPLDLLRDADTAMYHAKRMGPGHQRLFDQAMRDSAMRRLRVETELRRGLESPVGAGLLVHYQPIVNLTTGTVEGFEALARLVSSAGNLISPAEFIPLAESQGLIDQILDRVLEDAVGRVAEWAHMSPTLYVSVNVSARSINPQIVERVTTALARHELPTTSLKLELTESVLVAPSPAVAQTLETLRKSGVGLYLDDFGTGYSSLSYLHQFPADRIKLDRTFVMALDGQRMPEIVQTIVALSQRIGAAVIAEGIETRTQLAALRGLGCTAGQGFFFAPPLPPDAARKLLEVRRHWPIEELGLRSSEG